MLNSEEGDITTFIANGEWALLGNADINKKEM